MQQFGKRALMAFSALSVGLVTASASWSAENLDTVMKRRGLTEKDVLAAAKTYVPTGKRD